MTPRKRSKRYKAAHGGKASGRREAEADWAKLGNFDHLMKEINERTAKSARNVRKLPENPAAASQDASVVAILAIAMAADTHDVHDKADIPKWETLSADLRTKMAEVGRHSRRAMKRAPSRHLPSHRNLAGYYPPHGNPRQREVVTAI